MGGTRGESSRGGKSGRKRSASTSPPALASPTRRTSLPWPMNPPRIPRGPAVVLGVVTSATLYAIFYSHFQQVRDKAVMRAGVERDKERMRLKKRQQEGARVGEGGMR